MGQTNEFMCVRQRTGEHQETERTNNSSSSSSRRGEEQNSRSNNTLHWWGRQTDAKEVREGAPVEARVVVWAIHGKRLARARLAIGEDAHCHHKNRRKNSSSSGEEVSSHNHITAA